MHRGILGAPKHRAHLLDYPVRGPYMTVEVLACYYCTDLGRWQNKISMHGHRAEPMVDVVASIATMNSASIICL